MAAQSQSQSKNSPLHNDILYCHEDLILVPEDEQEQKQKQSHYITHSQIHHHQEEEDQVLAFLISKEKNTTINNVSPYSGPLIIQARRDAVDWIRNVITRFSFSPLTAVLSVNYFDRFLSSFQIQKEKPWMTHLTAVACLSLAAKVEETHVPRLLDLQQVEETRYLFEAKTVQRMEILVLSTLQWRMNPTTPLDFLNHIARRLGLSGNLFYQFLSRCESHIMSLLSDYRFVGYLPSVMATATMLYVIGGGIAEACLTAEYQSQLFGDLEIDKDKVKECCKVMLELASRGKRKIRCLPGSPNGVMDAAFSCENSNDSWAVDGSSPERALKKGRRGDAGEDVFWLDCSSSE